MQRHPNYVAVLAIVAAAIAVAPGSIAAAAGTGSQASNVAATRASTNSADPTASRRQLTIENDVNPPAAGARAHSPLRRSESGQPAPAFSAASLAAAASTGNEATLSTGHGFADTLRGMANSLLRIRSRFGGNTEEGLDCSGLVRLVWQRLGLGNLPRTAASMAAAGLPIARSELAPGDLVFFNTLGRSFSHVGVYLGEGRFLHASSSKRQVMLNSMNERYFQERFDGARRVVR